MRSTVKTKSRYYLYRYPQHNHQLSEREEVTYNVGRDRHSREWVSDSRIFVKETNGKLQVFSRIPFWNAWGWTDWVNSELEQQLRLDLKL